MTVIAFYLINVFCHPFTTYFNAKYIKLLIKLFLFPTQAEPEEQHKTFPVWRFFAGSSEA